jgi:capsular exopolysaccharide synthesis family protein
MAQGSQIEQSSPIDLRIYVGMLFFRWQTIVVCFLYCLLGGVIYVNWAPKKYMSYCSVMIYRDPKLEITRDYSELRSLSTHIYLLQSGPLRERVVERLRPKWGERLGQRGRLSLPVAAMRSRSYGPTVFVEVRGEHPQYSHEFLTVLIEEYRKEWDNMQNEATRSATERLTEELKNLEDKIAAAQNRVIEFRRLNDISRMEARASVESGYLGALVTRRSQLATEISMMEYQFPLLKDENVGVISAVDIMTSETGMLEPLELPEKAGEEMLRLDPDEVLPEALRRSDKLESQQLPPSWPELRVELARLQQKDKELARNLNPEHPSRREVEREIQAVHDKLEVAAQVAIQRLRDRHKALQLQLGAVEAAEYSWQAKDLLASQRRGQLSRLSAVVGRYEGNYGTLYSRLHDMRVSEDLQSEHIRVIDPVRTGSKPFWPDPMKILMMSVAMGLGSGFGLALLAQAVDNKVQSIRDVEGTLGVPFLGGVPYWAHSGLERTIRPIVTEEHSSGAIEAYRALRTNILSSMNKMNEKVLLVTSADSREGKTLTTLNLAIMIAQMGKKVLLVDMDLRRGRLHRSLSMKREPGITDILKEGGSLREIIQSTRIENLDLAPTGSSTEHSAELLQSRDLVGLFTDIQDGYDYIVVDTSPVLRVTDTVILATEGVGAVVYVARVNRTPKPLIRYSLDMLKDARILGLIMNSIEMHKVSSLYYAYQYPNYAYYSNAYSYGYNYYDYSDRGGGRGRRRSSSGGRWQSAIKRLKQTFLPMD